MMPLWTTATPPYECGCAFSSEGRPCVAQRVWPMPVQPGERRLGEQVDEVLQLPLGALHREPAGPTTATPAES